MTFVFTTEMMYPEGIESKDCSYIEEENKSISFIQHRHAFCREQINMFFWFISIIYAFFKRRKEYLEDSKKGNCSKLAIETKMSAKKMNNSFTIVLKN